MDDIVLVDVVESLEHVPHYLDGRALGVDLLGLDALEQLASVKVVQHQVNVLGALVDFVQLDDVRVVQIAHDVDLLQHRHDVSLAFLDPRLLYGLQRVLGLGGVSLARAAVNSGKVSLAEHLSHHEFIFEVEHDDGVLKRLDPLVDLGLVRVEEPQVLSLGHKDKSEQLRGRVLQVSFLEPGVLDLKDSSLKWVVIVVELDQLVLGVHEVLLFEISARALVDHVWRRS